MTRGSLEMWCELRGAGRRGMGVGGGDGVVADTWDVLAALGVLWHGASQISFYIQLHPSHSNPPSTPGIKEKFLLHILGCHPQPLPRASSPAAELEERALE